MDNKFYVYGGGAFLLAGALYYFFIRNDTGKVQPKIETAAGKPTPPVAAVPDYYDIDYTINKWIDNNPSYRANLNVIYTAYSMGEIPIEDAVERTRQLIKIYKNEYAGYMMRRGSI